jgi:hypothetical protein
LCEGSPTYTWESHTIQTNADSSYVEALATVNGCDSIVTYNVSIIPIEYTVVDTAICEGSPTYVWESHTIQTSSDSSYVETLPTADGCDSVVTYNVSIHPIVITVVDTAICEGTPAYTWESHTIETDVDSIYYETLTTIEGCDSTVTYNVLILPTKATVVDTALCEGSPSYAWESHTIMTNVDSTYIANLTTIVGCDSVVTYNVMVLPTAATIFDTVLCEGSPVYTWESHTIQTDADSSYFETLMTIDGCDSLVTYNVIIVPVSASVSDTSLCLNETAFDWNGHLITTLADSSYVANFTNAGGCDSIATLNVSILPLAATTIDTSVCIGAAPWTWNGHLIQTDVDSSYVNGFIGSNGCDSTVTYNVSILPVTVSITDTFICYGEPEFDWNGIMVSTEVDSTYATSLTNSYGCDSLVTLNVSIYEITYSITDTTILEAEAPLVWNGATYDTTGTYVITLPNAAGCDSILTLNLEILYGTESHSYDTICESETPYVWNSQSFDTTGTYSVLLTNANGGDSTAYLHLSVMETTYSIFDTTICEPELPLVYNGESYPVAGIYSDTLVNSQGCDSIITITINTWPTEQTIDTVEICNTDLPYIWQGETLTQEGTYFDTLQTQNGCDSVLMLTLIINVGELIDTTVFACEEFTWNWGDGNTYTSSGYYQYIDNVNAECQDTIRMTLIISPGIGLIAFPQPVSCYEGSDGAINISVMGGIPPYTYSWSNGASTRDISGLTEGMYYVTVTDSIGCTEFDSVYVPQPERIVITEIHQNVLLPGGTNGWIDITVSGGTPYASDPFYTYSWKDSLGFEIATTEDVSGLSAGLYTVEVTDANACVETLDVWIIEPLQFPVFGIVCPPPIILECYAELASYPPYNDFNEFIAAGGNANSDCGIDVSSFEYIGESQSGTTCPDTITRYYTVMDMCGQADTCSQYIIIHDVTPPVLNCPPDLTLVNAEAPAPFSTYSEFTAAGGTGSDNCGLVEPSFSLVGQVITGTVQLQITRTYEIADSCGNTDICEHVIDIDNSTALAIVCPPTINRSCPDTPLPPAFTTLAEFRAGGGEAISLLSPIIASSFDLVSQVTDSASCPETITRTYTLSNEAGQTVTCDHLIIRNDIQRPWVDIPSRVYYNCFSDVSPYRNLTDLDRRNPGANYGDNCQVAGIELVRERISGICPVVINRTYRVFDACGNLSREENQTITIYDETPPVVSDLPGITSDCTVPDPITNINDFIAQGVTVYEQCNNPVSMTYLKDSVAGPAEPNVIYRLYRFADNCDNGIIKLQKITVTGLVIPEFDTIDPMCQYSVPPLLPTVSNNGITGRWNPSTIQTNNAGTFVYIFTPDKGQCGAMVTMNIVVTPEILLSETHVDLGFTNDPIGSIDLTVEQGTPPYTFQWSNGATTEDISDLAAGTYTVQVIDAIGCEASLDVTITSDVVKMTCAPVMVIECPDLSAYPPFANYTEYYNAGGRAESSVGVDYDSFRFIGQDTLATDYCLGIERTYAIKDTLGNESTCTQIIYVDDKIDPVIECPPNASSECLSTLVSDIRTLSEFIAAGGKVSDNCEIDPESFTSVRTTNKLDKTTEVITAYSIADLCGNIATCEQTFILTDTIPPEAVCNDITVYLDENGQYVITDIDIEILSKGSDDNCTLPEDLLIEVDVTEVSCEDVEDGRTINVKVTDEAGNSTVCVANIVVVDELPPIAICQDITVYLDANGQVSITADMINNGSFDNCELDTVFLLKDQFDCTDVGINITELVAVDLWGNTDTCAANVNVIDQIPPYINCYGKQTVQLGEKGTFDLTWDIVADSVWDECGIDTVLLDKYILDCDDIGTVFITATAYDVNGNSSECTAEFEVFGNIAPNVQNDSAITAVNVPVDINVVNNDYDLKTSINIASLQVTINPSHGSFVVDNKTGVVTYTPNPGYVGTDIFRYSICDDGIPCIPMCGEALVFVTVLPANEPPIAVDDYFDIPCGDLEGNVITNDSDPDGDGLSVDPVPLVQPQDGYVILNSDGTFTYSPNPDFYGVDSFRYVLWDDGIPNLSDTAWVYITRVPDNDCDGIADVDDIDDDNDGIRDIMEGDRAIDSDNDGIPDSYDIDSDNDGILDNIEGQGETNYLPPLGRDTNGNGWDDAYDPEDGGWPFDINLTDTDDDTVPDFLDIDADNDGVFDFIEGHDENADGIADVIRVYGDSDFDGLDDAYDTSFGWALPGNETGSNAPLQDFDGDGTRDWRDVNDEDDEHMTNVEDLNGDGDYSNDDLDLDGYPEYLDTEMDCELFIPEGFSPNDDGVHDFFQILCIYPRYPNAKMMIFNRQGQKLFEKEHYGNYDVWGWEDAWWWGTSENTLTIGRSGGLPAGNYVYVLELGNGEVKNGTVMIAY